MLLWALTVSNIKGYLLFQDHLFCVHGSIFYAHEFQMVFSLSPESLFSLPSCMLDSSIWRFHNYIQLSAAKMSLLSFPNLYLMLLNLIIGASIQSITYNPDPGVDMDFLASPFSSSPSSFSFFKPSPPLHIYQLFNESF